MEQTGTRQANTMTTNEKWVMASTAAGFSLENMDIMFLSFALAPIIASLHISSAAAVRFSALSVIALVVLRRSLTRSLFLPSPRQQCFSPTHSR